ncbi:ribbon-helix-helix domain-containing protein [Maritalea sp.]|uniref:ribbon-helix-helix domain-containing protein n=1 Tax=Maritalea sp. TaxID=2003361 RepID=UPI003EF39BA7
MKKRSITIAGHRTSVALEDEFWIEIDALAKQRQLSLTQFIETIDQSRATTNLASALRLCVLEHLKNASDD